MQCPSCSLIFDQPNPERCPRCGYVLAAPTVQYMAGGPQPEGAPQPGAMGPAGGYAIPQPPNDPYGTAASTPAVPPPPPGYATTPPPPGYATTPPTVPAGFGQPNSPTRPYGSQGQPNGVPPTEPALPHPGYAPLGHTPTGAPQPGYPQPGSQPGYPAAGYAPPTPSPYAQTGAPQPAYPQPGVLQPGMPQGFPTQPRAKPSGKRSPGLIIGVIVAVVVLLLACGGGAFFGLRAFGSRIPGVSQLGIGGGNPTATSAPTAGGNGSAGSVIYQNTFAANATGWPEIPNECFYTSGGYHAVNSHACYAPVPDQSDLDVTVTVQQVTGPDTSQYGIVFRREGAGSSYQLNIISKGKWEFSVCKSNTCTKVIDYTSSSALHPGLNTANTLEVIAKGSHFEFFINGTNVGHFDDTTHASGKVGLVVTKNIECVFTNFIIKRPA